MMRGHVLRYLGWQIADRAGPRLLVMFVISLVLMIPLHFATRENPPPPEALPQLVEGVYFQLASLALVVLFGGIVAEDRTKGYYRFYLAKPASPLFFYGQSVALAILAMLAFTAGFLAMFSLLVVPAWHWNLMTEGAALGLLLGCLLFVLSTVTTLDWMWMVAVVIGQGYLRNRFPADESTPGKVLNAVLPPGHLTNNTSLTASEWAWVLAWAAGLFALALLILRLRPLGED